jgi:hypothetical protein
MDGITQRYVFRDLAFAFGVVLATLGLVSRSLHEKLVRAYAQEAGRLRDLAVSVTTARLRSRLLEEAENQERLAQAAKRGIVQPHPQPTRSMHW